MSRLRVPSQLMDLSPEELREYAASARQSANRPNNGLSAADRQTLWRNAYNLERLAAGKAKRYARQNRHPDHPTLQ